MKTCPQCGREFDPRRPHQIYESEECRYQGWVQRQVEDADPTRQRVKSGVGSRGGDVRSVEEARALHDEHKAEWTRIVASRIADVLRDRGRFHADDLAGIALPEQHSSIAGAQTSSFASRGLMRATGERRKVSHKAANARKANVYEITPKGRRELGPARAVAA